MQTIHRSAVVLGLLLCGPVAWAQPTPDHLQCFKIKDATPKKTYTADLTPGNPAFAPATGCVVAVPAKLLCVDVVKSNVLPLPPGSPAGEPAQTYLCYKTKCPKATPTATVSDQFGTHAVQVKSMSLLCAPVAGTSTTTTSTTTTSTTTTSTTTTMPLNCPGPSCTAVGQGCFANGDCCSNNCVSMVCAASQAGGCCQSTSDCSGVLVCVGGTCTGRLVLNEIDYDQASTDTASFVEIFNGTGAPVSLSSLALVLVDGTGNAEYFRQGLSAAGATLGAGQFLVVGNATVTGVLPPGVLSIDESGDWIQNGAPDGVALIDTSTNTLVDALSYEGSITSCTITGFPAPVSLVEGTPFPGADTNDNLHSLARSPNGQDTDDANADWQLTTTITPGAANP